ncbi:hypothetical protein FH880_10995 [Salmonella enterica]|nr:hypothetical protein [Salmonella enterica]
MDWREDSKGFRRGLKNHQTTADLVSNNSPLFVFCRYQIKCKSVSNNSPRYKQDLILLNLQPIILFIESRRALHVLWKYT